MHHSCSRCRRRGGFSARCGVTRACKNLSAQQHQRSLWQQQQQQQQPFVRHSGYSDSQFIGETLQSLGS